MDTYHATYHANPNETNDWNESWNETAPINYNAQNYMTNDAREISVESINIDNNADGKNTEFNGQMLHVYPPEDIHEKSYILIWKYLEQIKSIAGGMNTN